MLLGQRWSDLNFQEKVKSLHCRVQSKEHRPVITVNIKGQEHTFTPEHIAGLVMGKLRDTAAAKLGEDVGYAVVTVPTSFNDNQRQAVKDAGATVGLNVLRIINESTAAVIAYSLDRSDDEQNVVILDFGPSKTDVTVVEIDYGVIETLATVSTPISGRLYNRQLSD